MNSVDVIRRARYSVVGLQGGGRGKTLLAIASSSFLLIGVQMIYPVLLPELRATYGLGLGTAGLLLTVLWLANAAGQVPGGMLADQIGEGRVLVASTLLSAVAVILIVTADSVIALFALTILLGGSIALFGVARYTILENLFPDRVGTAVGIVLAAADAGQALLPPLAGVLAAAILWQLGFIYTLPLFIAVIVALWLYVPTSTATDGHDVAGTFSKENLVYAIENIYQGPVLYASGSFIVYMTVWITFTGFYPTYLIEVKGLAVTTAGILFGIFFAVGVAIKPLSGIAYDRIGVRRSIAIIAGISSVSLAALPLIDGLIPLIITTLLIAPILGSGTITQSYIIEVLPSETKGTGLGIVRTSGMMLAAMSPAVFGLLADRGFFHEVFLSLAVCAAAMILLIVPIPPHEV